MESVKFISTIWLFPLVFMFHDFEEIIFVEWWINKHKTLLLKKYPRIVKTYDGLSTASLALAVSEEFIVLLLITIGSVMLNWYYLWFGVLIGFLIHLVVHFIQRMVFKKYIPAIATTIPAIIYSIYAMYFTYNTSNMQVFTVVVWGFLGTITVLINLRLAHKLAHKFNNAIISNTK